ncbi:MAG: hypothetical protein AMK71_07705 [Nitrospira bacterium SG8_35_4]|nr:MAG: hypothetical protein AMK71_07705 [Nitrospira bacterium SG8_35_4]
MDYENNIHIALKNTYTLRLESIAFKVSKIIWFRNTSIILIVFTGLSGVVPVSGVYAITLTPDPLPLFLT